MIFKTFIGSFLVILIFSLVMACAAKPDLPDVELAHPELPRITCEELKASMDKGTTSMVLVDTQSTMGYGIGHIKGAINFPYDPVGDPMEREMMLVSLPSNKLLVIYCDCIDEGNSAVIALDLERLGYKRESIKLLRGGLGRWRELGYPLVAGNPADTK